METASPGGHDKCCTLKPFYRLAYDFDDAQGASRTNGHGSHDEKQRSGTAQARRGRHLRSNRSALAGELLWVERPLLIMPSLTSNNRITSWTCSNCHAFVGGPVAALKRRFAGNNGNISEPPNCSPRTHLGIFDGESASYQVFPCPHACGHVYCSPSCREMAWQLHHEFLCTGMCETMDAPLVQFVSFALETNEMFLLIAEWWVTQHVLKQRQKSDHTDTLQSQPREYDPYADFQMNPWWDVVVPLADGAQLNHAEETMKLQQSIRAMCLECANRFNVILNDINTSKPETTRQRIQFPLLTDVDVALRMGSLEQNIMGIRQRHPLCRDIFDRSLRESCHDEIVQCLHEAGFLGHDSDDEDDAESVQDTDIQDANGEEDEILQEDDDEASMDELDEGSTDFSVDQIAGAIADLFVDEEGTVEDQAIAAAKEAGKKRNAEIGDEMDALFPPFDGAAMFAHACKMNHSCAPNVILLYKNRGWGRYHPLTAFCVALRDIQEGDELTISYIDKEQSYEQRRRALAHYGFRCECDQCLQDLMEGCQAVAEADEAAGSMIHSDDEVKNTTMGTANPGQDGEGDLERAAENGGEQRLQHLFSRLETVGNHQLIGTLPSTTLAGACRFVDETVRSFTDQPSVSGNDTVANLLRQCLHALSERDHCLGNIVGMDLFELLYRKYESSSSRPSQFHKMGFVCSAIMSSLGYCHVGRFIQSMEVLDLAVACGLSREDRRLASFVAEIEYHAFNMSVTPRGPPGSSFGGIT
jgi:SET domain